MKKMILIFSHKLTEEQDAYARKYFDIEEFVYLPKELQYIWSNLDPDIEKLNLQKIKNFIVNSSHKDDVILVQGDFGACYEIVTFCKSLGIVPVYATTKRIVKEYINDEGKLEKKSIFEFRRLREYGV